MSKIKIYFNVLVFLLLVTHIQAQRFNFGIKGGLTFAQINGDGLAGYAKVGYETGAKSAVFINDRLDMNVELLYSQRGSSDELTWGGSNALFYVTLHYIAIPVLITVKDWKVEEDNASYHRMHFSAGLAYGRLFDVRGSSGFGTSFPTDDLSGILDINYHFNRHFSLNLRYTRSIISLGKYTANDITASVIPHHITMGVGYDFL